VCSEYLDLLTYRAGRVLDVLELKFGASHLWVYQKCYDCCTRYKLAKDFEPLRSEPNRENVNARGIAARAVEAADKSFLDRVFPARKHQRNRASGHLFRCHSGRSRCGNNHIHFLPDEIGHQPFMTCVVAVRPTEFNSDVLSLEIADLSQT